MIIFIGNKRQLASKLIKGLTLLVVLGLLVIMGISYLNQPAEVFNSYTEDKLPTGNPLRVNNDNPNALDQTIEQFVIKLQDFYYEERE